MTWPPHITVATVVERDGDFLVVEENVHGKPVSNQPAGHLEPGETLFEAALRETFEETGWRVELRHATGVYHYVSDEEAARSIEDSQAGTAVPLDFIKHIM